jgi:hypothetical protein
MPEARLERTRRNYMNEKGLERIADNLEALRRVSGPDHWLPETPQWLMQDFQRVLARTMRDGEAVSKLMK